MSDRTRRVRDFAPLPPREAVPAPRGYQPAPSPPPGAFTGEAREIALLQQTERVPAAGQEVRLPMQFASGSTVGVVVIPAGVGLRTVALSCDTPRISYAAFQTVGLDCIVDYVAPELGQPGAGPEDVLLSLILNTYNASGEIQLIYAPQRIAFAAQTRFGQTFERQGAVGELGARRSIPGVRENAYVRRNSRMELTATLRQEISNQHDITVTVQFAAVVRTLWDRHARIPGREHVRRTP